MKINTIAFQENSQPLEIVSMKWASRRGVGGAYRIIAYTQSEEYIRFSQVPLLNTPLNYCSQHQLTTYYGRIDQVETPYLKVSASYDMPATINPDAGFWSNADYGREFW